MDWACDPPAASDAAGTRTSAISCPVVVLRTSTRSVQPVVAGSAPLFTSCQDTVMGEPELISPPGALTASAATVMSGAGAVLGGVTGTAAARVSSYKSKVYDSGGAVSEPVSNTTRA